MTVRFGNNRLGFYGERHLRTPQPSRHRAAYVLDLTPSAPQVAVFILSGKVGNPEHCSPLSEPIIVV